MVVPALLLVCRVAAQYPSPNDAGFHHCVLMYDRDSRSAEELAPYVADMRNGVPRAWLFDAYLFLITRTPSGADTATGSCRRADWRYHLNRWFAPGRDLHALDAALTTAARTLGRPPGPRRIILSIPRPDRGIKNFGDVNGDGQPEDLSTDAGRQCVFAWYVRQARQRFAAAGFRHLSLWGFYWMHENIPPADTAMVRQCADIVHATENRLLWIPWFVAPGWKNWRSMGVDVAIMQPNYAFFSKHRDGIRQTRLAIGADLARRHGLGVEIELPMACDDPATDFYLRRYLATGTVTNRGYQAAATAYYLGRDNLDRLWKSPRSWQRRLYTDLAAYVAGEPVPDPDPVCTWDQGTTPNPALHDHNLSEAIPLEQAVGTLPTSRRIAAVDIVLAPTWEKGQTGTAKNPPAGKPRYPAESWWGQALVQGRKSLDEPWRPAGWALCTTDPFRSEWPRTLTVPVEADLRYLRVSMQGADGIGKAPVSEILLDGAPVSGAARCITHLALDAPYTITPPLGHPSYGDNGHELTDGMIPDAGFASGATVGWQGGKALIGFDLGRIERIDRVDVHAEGGGYAGVRWPASAMLRTGSTQMPPLRQAGKGTAPKDFFWMSATRRIIDHRRAPGAESGRLLFRPAEPLQARYVILSFVPKGWLMLSEIQIFSGERNLARGRDYFLRPVPSVKASQAYPDNGERLTDGRVATGFSRTMLSGWNQGDKRTITIRLPGPRDLRTVTVWSLVGESYAIRAPQCVAVDLSEDGIHWRRAGERRRPASQGRPGDQPCTALPYRIETPAKRIRAIRIDVTRTSGWTMLSEIQVD